ncbi:hypothetical protein V6N13_059793 [Hibiscus sabdariffa]|uniref:Uncharacterized protein n=1 Tax=Hibiscus sabdariffa TaxID=183260 RepID=A0ABR2GCV7_9ROSI
MSPNPLKGLTAGSTQGDETSPGKPLEWVSSPSSVRGGVPDARGLDLPTGDSVPGEDNCCEMTDLEARVSHVVDSENNGSRESEIVVVKDMLGGS